MRADYMHEHPLVTNHILSAMSGAITVNIDLGEEGRKLPPLFVVRRINTKIYSGVGVREVWKTERTGPE